MCCYYYSSLHYNLNYYPYDKLEFNLFNIN